MTRFPSCKFYDGCLDAAAFANGPLNCEGCRDFTPVKVDYEQALDDWHGCLALILRVLAGDKGQRKIWVFSKPRHKKPRGAKNTTISFPHAPTGPWRDI